MVTAKNPNTEMNEPFSLHNMTAVVTGSSRGIGKAIAMELAAAGADVLVHAGHDREAAAKVAEEIQQLGRQSHSLCCDVGDPSPCRDFLEAAWTWKDGIDIWVNNAGVDVLTGTGANFSFESKLDRLFKVDVAGTIRLARMVGDRMKSQGSGVILNMGWDQALEGQAGDSGELFAAAKGAIMTFTKSLAKSLAPEVRVNCLAPGWIKTAWGESTSEYWDQRARGESLLDRWGTPEDVARVARFLVSDAAGFMNGQIVPINGGSQPWPSALTKRTSDG